MYDSHLFTILLLLFLFCLVTGLIIWLTTGRIIFWSIYSSTRHLKIRDKGYVQPRILPSGIRVALNHVFCRTRVRVGITQGGIPVQYCWRCEQIFDDFGPDDDPKGKEPVPEENSSNVVRLFGT